MACEQVNMYAVRSDGDFDAAGEQYDESVRVFVMRGKVRKAHPDAASRNAKEQRELEHADCERAQD